MAMRRYDGLTALAGKLGDDALVVANLANTATEWRSVRPHEGNLYFVGMGMVTPYATGLALALPHRRIVALDGDGGILFDPGALATLAETAPPNLCVIVLDNESYASTGPTPPTVSLTGRVVDIAALGRACGLRHVHTAQSVDDLVGAVEAAFVTTDGPTLIVAKTTREQAFVGTSLMDGRENKYRFVRHIETTEGKIILRPSAKEHGEAPKPDPLSAPIDGDSDVGLVIHEGLRESEVDFVVGLPCSGMTGAQARCLADNGMRYVGVAHEATGIGLCAGAWMGGKRPAALFENLGLFASAYHLLRGNLTFGIPTLLIAEYRGDAGDQEFWADTGELTEPMLAAMRINHRVVRDMRELKPAIRDGIRWMSLASRPYAVVPGYDLTRLRR